MSFNFSIEITDFFAGLIKFIEFLIELISDCDKLYFIPRS